MIASAPKKLLALELVDPCSEDVNEVLIHLATCCFGFAINEIEFRVRLKTVIVPYARLENLRQSAAVEVIANTG